MPFYDYRCQACGHEFEAMQKINDAPLLTCPACQADALQKQLSAPAFRLKGGGWYETDFKSDNKRNLHDSGHDSANAASKAETTKSETSGTTDSKKSTTSGDAKPA
jgi:putative FmdB family regulatory protein